MTIQANSDVLAGRAAFLASGVPTVEFNWQAAAGSTYQSGVLDPQYHLPSVTVPAPGGGDNVIAGGNFGAACTNSHPTPIALANWVDAPGFDNPDGSAAADLAINDIESFELQFALPHRSVGFAVITGAGNLPSDVDLNGAGFEITALDAGDTVVGSATFVLPPGQVGARAWLTITSDVPFTRLVVCENNAPSVSDQYFSNILTSEQLVPACPPSPATGCITNFAKAKLLLDEKVPGKERMSCKWQSGPTLAGANLGNPVGGAGTTYSVCIYGDTGLAGTYVVDRAGDLCAGKSCWKGVGGVPPTGYQYKDRNAAADGIQVMQLKGGVARSKMSVKGRNSSTKGQVALPTGVVAAITGSASVTIQLLGSDVPPPGCFSETLTVVQKDDGGRFKAKK